MSEASFFYNVRTGAVEEVDKRDKAQDLMGPYPTREAAQHALETARDRTEAWDRQDAEDD
ncbi:SPOR domain-containing protein [Kineococcus rubinsiae]|uniref:SPOR domain-containing protein n=1 Tax=Kineococcus rubinsiae TaxID=2609562 RepID=UPI00142FF461|nr:SPOR domain-containing protein [Kineococcus rubinsiae]NIZ90993.1 SPOR domain-containing protein [Kineococcus rubinsiae]